MSEKPSLVERAGIAVLGVLMFGGLAWGAYSASSLGDEEPAPPPDQGPAGEPWPELPAEDAGGY